MPLLKCCSRIAAAISSCHEGFGDRPVFANPLVKPPPVSYRGLGDNVMRVSAPQWKLLLVLEALVSNSYEPLEGSSLKSLSFKTALLLVLTSAKRVSELCALSVHPSCLLLHGDHSSATLRPNPSFVPKNIRSSFR